MKIPLLETVFLWWPSFWVTWALMNFIIFFQVKASRSNNGPYDFVNLKPIQDLGGEHTVSTV
jgi:hypothetical protein